MTYDIITTNSGTKTYLEFGHVLTADMSHSKECGDAEYTLKVFVYVIGVSRH